MKFIDSLRLNILSAHAVEAGADPDRTWPIVVFAPPGPSYRLKTPSKEAMIMTRGFWAATVEALQEMAEISIPVPCFNDHSNAASGDPRLGKLRVIPADPTAGQRPDRRHLFLNLGRRPVCRNRHAGSC